MPLKKLSAIQILLIGYIAVITTVAILLSLPVSSATGARQAFIDALFVATSGISTTGLTPVDIGSYYSLFGQLVLLIDIQIGGLGYMAFFIFIASLLQAKLSMKSHRIASESVSGTAPGFNLKFFKKVVGFTLLFESIGAVILGFCWLEKFSPLKAFYFGIFHSVNAFCTAGFGLFPDSFISYNTHLVVNLIIIIISAIGGIGFYVINEAYYIGKNLLAAKTPKKLSLHSKLAIITTFVLVIIGTAVFFLSENWDQNLQMHNRFLISLFQAVSAQTTDGYNTVDIGKMSLTSLFMLIILMFTGASPGSTGGGIKTTTLGTLFLSAKSYLSGDNTVHFKKRRISEDTITKSIAVFFMFILICAIDMLILTWVQGFNFHQIFFEIMSALGNVGLSTGITASLGSISKCILIITMFIGRVGPLTIAFAFAKNRAYANFKYPIEDVFVG